MSEENKATDLTPEQLRQYYTLSFKTLYCGVIDFLNKLPLNPQLRSFSYMNFDQG